MLWTGIICPVATARSPRFIPGALSACTRYEAAVPFFLVSLLGISMLLAGVGHAAEPVAAAAPRVFFAPLSAGAAADPAVVDIIEERLLTSARRHRGFDVVAARDVQSMLDLEAVRQQSGCDDGGVACAAELAGALDAPQVVTGQLGRVGSTWVLSLTRMDRVTMQVLARVSRQRRGDTAEELLGDIDGVVDELFVGTIASAASVSSSSTSWLVPAGAVMAGVGVVGLVVGGGATFLSFRTYDEAKTALAASGQSEAERAAALSTAKERGTVLNAAAVGGFVVGGVVVVVGATALTAGLLQGGE